MDQTSGEVKAKRWYLRWYMWIVYVLVGIIVLSVNSAKDKAQQIAQNGGVIPGATDVAAQDQEKLELVSYTCGREYGFFKITGAVKNISGASLKNVEAVGSIYTDDGTFVKSDNAIVEYNPILPGQTSPFTVMSTDNPAASKCQIEFKELFGGTIPTKVDKK